jgi:hypothetical protein
VVLVLLGPADEDRAVAVQPGVARLSHPAACLPLWVVFLVVDLFAAGTDVGGEQVFLGELARLAVVVGLIQAQPLRPATR